MLYQRCELIMNCRCKVFLCLSSCVTEDYLFVFILSCFVFEHYSDLIFVCQESFLGQHYFTKEHTDIPSNKALCILTKQIKTSWYIASSNCCNSMVFKKQLFRTVSNWMLTFDARLLIFTVYLLFPNCLNFELYVWYFWSRFNKVLLLVCEKCCFVEFFFHV